MCPSDSAYGFRKARGSAAQHALSSIVLRHALAQRHTCRRMLRLAPTGTDSIVLQLRSNGRAGESGAARA